MESRWRMTLSRADFLFSAFTTYQGTCLVSVSYTHLDVYKRQVCGAYLCARILPLQSSGPLRDFALQRNGDLREEIGWPELVRTVAGIRDSLTPEQQPSMGVIVGNYGEQGAIEMLGPPYHCLLYTSRCV